MKTPFNKAKIAIASLVFGTLLFFGFRSGDQLFEVSKNLEIFNAVFRELSMNYVDEPESGKLIKVGIDAILKELDPYTTYIPESQIEDYRFMTTGKYGGIGALIRKIDSNIYIAEPYADSPALKNGLRAGDILIKVAGKDVQNKNISEVSDLLKGKAGSEVEIEYLRNAKRQKIAFNREEIKLPDVPFQRMLSEKTGYIKLNRFTQSASQEVKTAFMDLKEKGMENLVFDLRGNGGGLLMEAVKIVNFFIPKGNEVVSVRGRVEAYNQVHATRAEPLDTLIPITILVDGGTASASEIVSGALQDYDRAVIVGTTTFGKGLVQNTKDLSYNAKIKLTTAKYYIPSGRCIQRIQYSNDNNSRNAKAIPDSLLKEFTTLGGRKVMDGRGIEPDITLTDSLPEDILRSLYSDSHFFKFTNQFVASNAEPASVEDIAFGETEFAAFIAYLKSENFDHLSDAEQQLEKLEEAMEDISPSQKVLDLAKELKQALAHEEWELINENKELIINLLENEYASRFFYQKGRFEISLDSDKTLLEAMAILNDSRRLNDLLQVAN